jgi:arsenite transporter
MGASLVSAGVRRGDRPIYRQGGFVSSAAETALRRPAAALGTFERYLTLWVGLCILAGIVLGQLLPAPFQALGRMTIAQVNIPVAILIWLMIVPMLLKVDFGALHRVAEQWRGIAVTVGINWLVKPFSMALLGWLFIDWLFRPWLPAAQIHSYIAGLIILAAAPCTAMVFVWSNLTAGDANFTLSQVALNDTIMVFAFAPNRRAVARSVFDRCAVDDTVPVGGALHPLAGGRGAAMASAAPRHRG